MPVITRSQRKAIKENNERIIKTHSPRIQENNERIIKTRSQQIQEQKEKANEFLKKVKNINDLQVRFAKNENEIEKKQMEKLRIHIELFHLINTSFEYDENSEIEIQKDVTRMIYKKSIEFYNKTVCKLNKKFINEEEMKALIKSALYEFQLTQDMVINSRNK